MKIHTTRFGDLTVEPDSVIRFPRGLYGFEQARRFCLVRYDAAGLFHWLQSTDIPSLAVILADPFSFFQDYAVEISESDAQLLQARNPSQLEIHTVVTGSAEAGELALNLLGPVVINSRQRVGLQVIQPGEVYQTRHPVRLAEPAEKAA